jgi:hypothetical protein
MFVNEYSVPYLLALFQVPLGRVRDLGTGAATGIVARTGTGNTRAAGAVGGEATAPVPTSIGRSDAGRGRGDSVEQLFSSSSLTLQQNKQWVETNPSSICIFPTDIRFPPPHGTILKALIRMLMRKYGC